MIGADAERFLSQPDLARVLGAARERREQLGRVGGTVALELTDSEALALDGIWPEGRRVRPRGGRRFAIALPVFDAALREALDADLDAVLEHAGGPLRDRPAERLASITARADSWARALAHPLCERDPAVRGWVERLRRQGGVRAGGFERLGAALDVGATLPRRPPVERTALAAELLGGDPHALDDRRPLTRLLLGQLAARAGVAGSLSAPEARLLWQRFGVLCDPASCTVLTLGLAPRGDGPLAGALRLLRGRHVALTLGQLSSEPLDLAHEPVAFTCENPTVILRAEAALAASSPPLICTGGWPNSAVAALLDRLPGARILHHGDFDWEGVAIAGLMADRYGARPWRFDAASYRAGLRPALPRLEGEPSRGSDGELVAAMRAAGAELHEELVLDELLADLSPGSG